MGQDLAMDGLWKPGHIPLFTAQMNEKVKGEPHLHGALYSIDALMTCYTLYDLARGLGGS